MAQGGDAASAPDRTPPAHLPAAGHTQQWHYHPLASSSPEPKGRTSLTPLMQRHGLCGGHDKENGAPLLLLLLLLLLAILRPLLDNNTWLQTRRRARRAPGC